jgi:hypothetical protein
MRVLVVGSAPVSIRRAADRLERAGHDVVRCHDDHGPAFPCAALREERGCPLEVDVVDVVLDVHDVVAATPSPYEDGAACGVREHIPLVVATPGEHPYERWTTHRAVRDDDIVAACEQAARAPSARHSEIAGAAVRDSLTLAGIHPEGAHASVQRRDGSLHVLLTLPDHPEGLESMIVARVISAVRAYDDRARGVDVTIV